MSFFDTTPLGRIVNRFAQDIDIVDGTIPGTVKGWLNQLNPIIATIVAISYSTPLFLIMIIPLAVLYIAIQVRPCLVYVYIYNK